MVDNPLAEPDADGVERTENLPISQVSTPQLPFHAPLPPLPDEDAVPTQEITAEAPPSEGGALLLKQEGKTYQVKDLATIQRWILERRVLREDMISREGLRWEPAQAHPDLELFFATIERLEFLESAPPAVALSGAPMPPLPDNVPMGNALVDRPFAPSEALQEAFALEGDLPADATEEFYDEGPVMLFVPPSSADSPFARDDAGPSPAAERGEPSAWPEPPSQPESTEERDLPSETPSQPSDASADDLSREPFFDPEPRREEPEQRSPALLIILLSCLVLAVLLAVLKLGDDEDTVAPAPTHQAPVKPAPSGGPSPGPDVPGAGNPGPTPTNGGPPTPGVDQGGPTPPEPGGQPTPGAEQAGPKPQKDEGTPTSGPDKPKPDPGPVVPPPPPKPKKSADKLANEGWDAMSRDLNKAEALFREALDIRPTHPLALYGQGYAAAQRGDSATAVRFYCAAQGYGKDDPDLQREVGALLNNLGATCN